MEWDKLFLAERENLIFSWKLCLYFNDKHRSGSIRFTTCLASHVFGATGESWIVLTQSITAAEELLCKSFTAIPLLQQPFPHLPIDSSIDWLHRGCSHLIVSYLCEHHPDVLGEVRGGGKDQGQGSSAATWAWRCLVTSTGARVIASLQCLGTCSRNTRYCWCCNFSIILKMIKKIILRRFWFFFFLILVWWA